MIYLDHNATTPVLPEVLEAMMPFFTTEWGNPSSSYKFGSKLKKVIETAREQVADLVGAHLLIGVQIAEPRDNSLDDDETVTGRERILVLGDDKQFVFGQDALTLNVAKWFHSPTGQFRSFQPDWKPWLIAI